MSPHLKQNRGKMFGYRRPPDPIRDEVKAQGIIPVTLYDKLTWLETKNKQTEAGLRLQKEGLGRIEEGIKRAEQIVETNKKQQLEIKDFLLKHFNIDYEALKIIKKL